MMGSRALGSTFCREPVPVPYLKATYIMIDRFPL